MAGATDFEKGAELLDRGKIGAAIEFFAKAGESGHADGAEEEEGPEAGHARIRTSMRKVQCRASRTATTRTRTCSGPARSSTPPDVVVGA